MPDKENTKREKESYAMDIKFLKKLSELMKTENLKTLEISEKDVRVHLVKHDGGVQEVRTVAASVESSVSKAQISTGDKAAVHLKSSGFEVKSPLVGVYYAAPAPDAAHYVTEGKRVKKGDILCIIEAMKQMNEIVAEIDGEVVQVCIKNGDIVEYDQTLFRIV